MGVTTTIGLFLGGASAIESFVQGRSMSNEALRGLEAFERQKLINPYEGLTPSLDVERTALDTFNQTEANMYDVAQGQDAASAQALVSQGTEQVNAQRQKTFDTMRKEVANIDFATAQDETRIRNMVEARDQYELDSLRDTLAAGQEMKYDALTGLSKMTLATGLAQENRLAGLGQDDIAARRDRIESGTATIGDYIAEGDYDSAFKLYQQNNNSGDNTDKK